MRVTYLRGLPVVDPTTARKIGTVSDYQLDPAAGQLVALDITTADGASSVRVPADRVRRVGRNAVVLIAQTGVGSPAAVSVDERWLDAATVSGLEVLGDDGLRIGKLVDANFDQDSLRIQTYVMRRTGWKSIFGASAKVEPARVHSCSRELMLLNTRTGTVDTPPAEVPAVVDGDGSRIAQLSTRVPLKDADRPSSAPVVEQAAETPSAVAH